MARNGFGFCKESGAFPMGLKSRYKHPSTLTTDLCSFKKETVTGNKMSYNGFTSKGGAQL